MDIEYRDDNFDIGLIMLVLGTGVRAIVNDKPGPKHEKTAGERDEMRGIEQIEDSTPEREHRESADAAWPPFPRLRKEFLECQPEKETQAEKQRNADRCRCCAHEALRNSKVGSKIVLLFNRVITYRGNTKKCEWNAAQSQWAHGPFASALRFEYANRPAIRPSNAAGRCVA